MVSDVELAVELVRVSTMATLRRAVLSESLSDVLGVHESVLRARLGAWSAAAERDALYLVSKAVSGAVEESDFQNDDDAEISEADVIARVERG